MDVQVGELVRTYWAPWLHGPGPAAERVSAGDPRAFGLPSAGLVFLGHTCEVGIEVRWEGTRRCCHSQRPILNDHYSMINN